MFATNIVETNKPGSPGGQPSSIPDGKGSLVAWSIGCFLMAFLTTAWADKTINFYQNINHAGYPYFGIADSYTLTLTVKQGVQTHMPQGNYSVYFAMFGKESGDWAQDFYTSGWLPYHVNAAGVVDSTGTYTTSRGFSVENWWSYESNNTTPSEIQFRSTFTDKDGNPHVRIVTTVQQGNVATSGTGSFADLPVILADSLNLTEAFQLDPSQGCSCNCNPGTSDSQEGSIDYTIHLGKDNFGDDQGTLAIQSDYAASYLSTPGGLKDRIVSPGCISIFQPSGLRQVLCSQSLVDVEAVNNYKYQIQFYYRSPGDPMTPDGLYQCGGGPFKTITVENPDASPTIYNRLLLTESAAGVPNKVTEYDWSASDNRWDMFTGNGLRRESLVTVIDAPTGDRLKTRSVLNPAGVVVTKKVQRFHTYSWAEEMISETLDPDGAALTSTWTYFDNGDTTPGAFVGKLKQTVASRGGWERYEYNANGAETKHVTSFLDAPLGSPDNQCRAVTTAYSDANPAETIVETLQGVEISRRYLAGTPDGQQQEIVCQQVGAAWNAPGNLITTRNTDGTGEILREQRPDGTLTLGTYTVSGNQKTSVVSVGAPSADSTTVVDGTTTTTAVDPNGNQLLQTVMDIASGLMLSSATTVQTDTFGRPTRVVDASGNSELTNYGCCGVDSRTDRDGNTISYTYDALSRVASVTQAGLTTLYTYDADGRRTATVRQGSDGSQITTELLTYDLASRQTTRTDALGHVTASAETIDPATGHTVRTTTLPDDAHSTRIETSLQDGTLLNVGGTAAHPLLYAHGADAAAGAWRQEIRVGDGGAASEWTMTYTDTAGRDYKTLTAAGAVAQRSFNAQNQITRSVDPDGVTTLYGYNARGEQETVAIDMDLDGQIDFAGTDRITRTTRSVVQAHGKVVTRTTTSAWALNGMDAASVMAVDDQSVDGRSSWHTDAAGLITSGVTSCDGAGTCSKIVTEPDGSYMVLIAQARRPVSRTRYDANAQTLSGTTMDYDPQGRLWHQTDLRDGVTTFVYDNDDQLRSVSHAGQITGYNYDALGRKTLETQPDNGQVLTAYWPTGEVQSVGGARTYPQSYAYDSIGRLKTLTTQGAAGAEVTTWNYDAQSGQMTSKAYADGKGPAYTYTPARRLATRTWARGIVTTYGYDNAGQLASITYSDGTTSPAVYTFDRLGRLAMASGGGNVRALVYQGNTSLMVSETFTAGPLAGMSVNTGYDGLLRRSSLQVNQGQTNLVTQSFGFDAASRLASASEGTVGAAYAYWLQSAVSLVQSITFSNSASGGNAPLVMTTTKTYDLLDRLTGISSTVAGAVTPVSGYNYTYNAANERMRADVAADGTHWNYGYDALGQVTGASRQWSDGSAVGGQQFGYVYDQIGNRTSATTNGRQSVYTSNLLNQYGRRTVPGTVDVIGTADPNATVTLDQQPTLRQSGGYFAGTATANNSQAAVDVPVNVAAVEQGAGTNANALGVQQGSVFLPQTPELFGYDADGNLTQDGHWTYTWDGENRLIGIEAFSSMPTVERKKLAFDYDDTGRRTQKQVWNWSAANNSYQTGAHMLFAYDSWNLIAEFNGANNGIVMHSYLWGLDLSGSLRGAGGVAGLLSMTDHMAAADMQTNCACCDGIGNVTALVKAQDGKVSAQYDYGPFGDVIRMTGSVAQINSIRFSSKYTESENGFINYGYRILNASIGRWINKDPIEEKGGINIYALVNNNPINLFDGLGLSGDVLGSASNVRIDTDGTPEPLEDPPHGDPDWRPGTALPGMNADQDIYAVKPRNGAGHTGECVLITANGRTVQGVIGDVGPEANGWGEVSYAAVQALGIPIKDFAFDSKGHLVGPIPVGTFPVVIKECSCKKKSNQ